MEPHFIVQNKNKIMVPLYILKTRPPSATNDMNFETNNNNKFIFNERFRK